MKLLIMCEGPNELKIINILLENQKLKFTSDDLLGLVPYHARQIKSSAAVKAALNLYPDEVHVLHKQFSHPDAPSESGQSSAASPEFHLP